MQRSACSRDALDPAHPQEHEAEVVLEVAELALDGGAAAVERAPAVGTTRDAELPLGLARAEGDDRGAAAVVALGVDAVVVVGLVSRTLPVQTARWSL